MQQGERTNTPKKYIKKRNTNVINWNNYCRCCKVSLRIKYGDSWKSVSSVNIFEKSSRQVFQGTILSDLLHKDAGIICEKLPNLSDRLCNACALKIKNTCYGLSFIRNTLNVPHPTLIDEREKENEKSNATIEIRTKRTLPTTVSTPERSPNQKKVARTDNGDRCKKSLQYDNGTTNNDLRLFNTDDICVSDKKAKVKVMIQWPNGRTEVRIPSAEEQESTSIIKNLALKRWDHVCKAVWTHPALRSLMLKSVWTVINHELSTYCSSPDCIFKQKATKEIISFSTKAAVDEICSKCPTWFHCIKGACGIKCDEDVSGFFAVNSIALATSVAARVRNKYLSALTYRISSILFHSGAKNQDIIRLNRLGVCMSPESILNLQRCLGRNFDAKVLEWKRSLEEQPAETLALLQETVEKQLSTQENSTDLNTVVDIREESLKTYKHYKPQVFTRVCAELESKRKKKLKESITADVLQDTVCESSSITKFPLFKYVFFS